MDMSLLLFFFIGLIVGALLGWLIGKVKSVRKTMPNAEANQLENEKISLQKDVEHLNQRLERSILEFKEQDLREKALIEEKIELTRQLSSTENDLKNLNEKLTNQQKEMDKLQDLFMKEFRATADAILKQNTREFSAAHQKELKELLHPLRDKIQSFESNIEKKYIDETKERSSLKQEIKQLVELNQTLNEQAENLTTALRGENKTQGNWGEMVLERILENSGLIKGQEYEIQYSDTNQDNKRIQADVIVNLPDKKHIIIDSKVSLVAYEQLIQSDEKEEKQRFLKQHLTSIKAHVKTLGDKNYQTAATLNSPDFVVLFIPIESSFSLAIQGEPDLYNYAWDRKVVIVSPTTLLATLRTIASVWKHENQIKNARKISENASKLYDKVAAFVEDLQRVGKGLKTAQDAYDLALNKLSTGRGNIVRRTEHFKELRVDSTKELPQELFGHDD
ncbi:MAG: DNA recombination protein RmuC [Verrucomicrobia bacterium]|nr:DNA recombination protein RmuC [Verrucomicrobiota bacterium]